MQCLPARRLTNLLAAAETIGHDDGLGIRLSDGRHVFELHLSESAPRLSVRFALAHPASVDAAFLDVIRHLMTHAAVRVRVLSDGPAEFTLAEFDQFAAHARRCIAHERRVWVATFGPQTFAGSTAEVYRRIILPHCDPAVGRQA